MSGIVVFDVDGTLTATTGVDDECLCVAWERVLGARNVETDWSKYQHSTDEGLTLEVSQRARGRAPSPDEMHSVKQEFFALLHERTEAVPECCLPVPGACELLAELRGAGWRIGIASGAWEESARIKLRRAGVDVAGFPGTFSYAKAGGEPAVREEIVSATVRALSPSAADRAVYVGDGPWDARAAGALGLGFVGVRVDGREERLRREGAVSIVRDFRDTRGVIAMIESAS